MSIFKGPYGLIDIERQDSTYFYNAFQTNVFSIVADYYQDNSPMTNFKLVTNAFKANSRLFEISGQYCHMRDLLTQGKALRDTWSTIDVMTDRYLDHVLTDSDNSDHSDTTGDSDSPELDLPDVDDSDDSGIGSGHSMDLESNEIHQ